MGQSWITAVGAEMGALYREYDCEGHLQGGLSGWAPRRTLWPLDVPAQVGHLNVAPDHEGAGQVEAVLGVGSDELVLFTEGVTEHLIQSEEREEGGTGAEWE